MRIAGRVRRIRDLTQHVEEMLADGTIPNNANFMLMAEGDEVPVPGEPGQTIKTIDRLTIGKEEVLFTELHDWLTQRARWLSRNEVRLAALRTRTPERERTAWVPVDLHDPMSSPVDVTWGIEHRTCAIRAVTQPFPGGTRFEHRVSGCDTNPYLVVLDRQFRSDADIR